MPGRHARDGGARAIERAQHIDVEDVTQGGGRDRLDPRALAGDAGIVHQVGEAAELTVDGLEHARDVGLAAHVALDRNGAPARRLHLGDHAGRGFGVALVVDRDVVTVPGGEANAGRADAAAAAGD